MKKYRYQIHPQADADLDNHAQNITREDLEAGLRLYDLAQETYEMLCDMPHMGVIHQTARAKLVGVRYISIKEFSRYLVFYKVRDKIITIIRVLHARMDKDGWL